MANDLELFTIHITELGGEKTIRYEYKQNLTDSGLGATGVKKYSDLTVQQKAIYDAFVSMVDALL